MPRIAVSNFKGTMPQSGARELPLNYAQTALNCDFRRNVLQAIYKTDLQGTVQKSAPAKIFKCDTKWETWTSLVDVVRGWVYDSNPHFYYSDGTKPKQTKLDLINDALQSAVASTAYDLGIAAPSSAPTLAFTYDGGTPGDNIQATIAYVFTYVAVLGNEEKESAPSPASAVGEIYDDGYCTVSCPTPSGERGAATNISKIRIYRIASGTAGADYQYLAEVTISGTPTTYDDRDGANYAITPTADLGAAIQTEGWDPPPDAIEGLHSWANGLMAGFLGNEVWINEPFIPYAFPDEYKKQLESDLVCLASITGSNVLVATTKTYPYRLAGTDPQSIVPEKLTDQLGNLSKRATISTPHGVIYPSPEGLVLIGLGVNRVLTRETITKKQWNALSLSDLIGAYYDDKYYGFYKDTNTGIIYDFMTEQPYFINVTLNDYPGSNAIQVKDLYVDTESDTLYLLVYSADTNYYLLKYEKDSSNQLTYTWKSKKFSFNRPTNLGAGRIKGASNTVFKLYAGESLKKTATITNEAVFRNPSGFLDTDWEFQLEGTDDIDEVVLAEVPDEI